MKKLIFPLLLLCLPILVSCAGFSPVYAENSPSRKNFSQIAMQPILGKNGFLLGQEMQNRGGIQTGDNGKYLLRVDLGPSRVGFAVRVDNVATRFEIQMDANWALLDDQGAVLTTMKTHSSSTFDSPSSPYASQVAEEDAESRAVAVLADSILDQLGFYFASETGSK